MYKFYNSVITTEEDKAYWRDKFGVENKRRLHVILLSVDVCHFDDHVARAHVLCGADGGVNVDAATKLANGAYPLRWIIDFIKHSEIICGRCRLLGGVDGVVVNGVVNGFIRVALMGKLLTYTEMQV